MPPNAGMMMQNPHVGTIRTMYTIVRILAALVAIVSLLGAIVFALTIFGIVVSFFLILIFIVSLLIFMKMGSLRQMVDSGQLGAAKESTLIWMILGFIFGGVITGILLLIAYLKFDSAIQWQQQLQTSQPPAWGAPPAAMGMPVASSAPMAPGAPAAPAGGAAPICPRCRQPGTWIAQYNRWYCYNDQQYL